MALAVALLHGSAPALSVALICSTVVVATISSNAFFKVNLGEGLRNPKYLWRGSKIIAIIAVDVEGKLSESICRGRKKKIGAGLSIAYAQIASSSRELQTHMYYITDIPSFVWPAETALWP